MSLRRRIAVAVAVSVAVVVVVLAAVVYASVRSHLRGDVEHSLAQIVAPMLADHDGAGGPGGGPAPRADPAAPPGRPAPGAGRPDRDYNLPPVAFGGAGGVVQSVDPSGAVRSLRGTDRLPVDARVKRLAAAGHGSYYSDLTSKGTHLRLLTIADHDDGTALQVALPLTGADRVQHELLLTFAIVIGAGILLAALLGGLIGRTALAPIARFTRHTESVSGALDRSERLEEEGAPELARLAASFNSTLDALERSVAAQRHLLADASHELRTPISALRSNIQIYLDRERLPLEDQVALRESIIAELDELTQLVADVVELARGSEPGEAVEPLRLDALVEQAVERTRRRAPELDFDLALEPTTIEHQPDRIARAVTNLLDNARKWSPPGSRVEVRLAGGVLAVRDHGPGFDAADLPHVFDRFYRAERARRMPGSGLGLAIVRQAAEARGGFATAENAPGGGALLRAGFGTPVADAERVSEPA